MISWMKRNPYITASVYLVLGLFMVLFPKTSIQTICLIIGIALIVYSITRFLLFYEARNEKIWLITGIVLLVLGIIFILSPEFVIGFVPIILGIYLLVQGVTGIVFAIDLKKLGRIRWPISLSISAIVTVAGLLLVFNPFSVYELVFLAAGIGLIINALSIFARRLLS